MIFKTIFIQSLPIMVDICKTDALYDGGEEI